MKKFLPLVAGLFFTTLFFNPASLEAQCTIDSSLSSPGFTPNPLPNGCKNQPYDQDVTFLFPNDTTVAIPFPPYSVTVPFDSFLVSDVLNIPAGLAYACNIANCHYITNPPNPTYGCVKVSGTPTDTTMITDSISVIGVAYITVFGSPQSFSDTVNIGLKIDGQCAASIDQSLANQMHFTVSPNPVSSETKVSFMLNKSAQVELYVTDVFGRRVCTLTNGFRMPGEFITEMSGLPSLAPGVYFLNLNLDGTPSVSEKIISVY